MDREATAYHEAGHAIIAHELGADVDNITCDSSGRERGHCTLKESMSAENHAVWSAAGTEAQRKFLESKGVKKGIGQDDGCMDDLDGVLDAAEVESGTDDLGSNAAIINARWERARKMVEDHWPQIERLANELMRRGTMTGDDIRSVIMT